jgi:SNF2 family DNA or RNA helicase
VADAVNFFLDKLFSPDYGRWRVREEKSLMAELFAFQRAGVEFLRSRRKCLLGDEMGLGKTAQACAAIEDSALVVCKASLKYVWRDEVAKWRPDLKFSALKPGAKHFRTPGRCEVVATSYDSLPDWLTPKHTGEVNFRGRDVKRADVPSAAAVALRKATLIVDEAHATKNWTSLRSQRVKTLGRLCSRMWMLTGTPLLSHPKDLFGVLDVGGMAWDLFGSWQNYCDLFGAEKSGPWGETVWRDPKPHVPEILRRVMLRRIRQEVMPELPSKIWQTIDCGEPGSKTWKLLDSLAFKVDELEKSGAPLDLSDFFHVRAVLAQERIGAMLEIVESHEDQFQPLVVFSAHRAPIDALDGRERWKTITGDTTEKNRAEYVRAFQDGALAGLGLTIGAGGVGITLTRGSTALFVDLDVTPALNAQAEDRLVRIGQEASSVLIMRMVSSHPVDRRVHKILEEKIKLFNAAIDGRRAS